MPNRKAIPIKILDRHYVECSVEEATHVTIKLPGPTGKVILPVILHGTRDGTNCWSWNGNVELPTLKPSLLTEGVRENTKYKCHSWINDGNVRFLPDCSHEFVGQTVELLPVDPPVTRVES